MNRSGHLLTGYITGLTFIIITYFSIGWFADYSILNMIIWLFVIGMYSLVCDLDHKMSTITWLFVGFSVIGLVYGFLFDMTIAYYSFGLLLFTFICAQLFPHRGFIHSISFCILASIPLFFIFGLPVATLGLASAYSHLIADDEPFKLF